MNISLSYLNIMNLATSPYMQLAQKNKYSSFSLTNSYISKSSSTFFNYLGHSEYVRLTIVNTIFHQFLMTPISFSQEKIIKDNIIFDSTFVENSGSNVTIMNCQFKNLISNSPGAGIHIESTNTHLSVSRSLFDVCRCQGKGGAIFALMYHFLCEYNCFHLCKCGNQNGNDGSTIYASSKIGIETQYVSAHECPQYDDQCWYGIIILCYGVLNSKNINMSNSDVEFISGLAHFRPEKDQSHLRFYTSVNQIHGNSLAFIDMTFRGDHEFGSLVNDSSKTGIFYVQNSTTTLKKFYFLNNKGPLTYACVGISKGNFEECVFSSPKENVGIGFGNADNCMFNMASATTLSMDLYATVACNGDSVPKENIDNILKININKNGGSDSRLNELKNSKDLMLLILIFGLLFVIYIFYSRFIGKRVKHRGRFL